MQLFADGSFLRNTNHSAEGAVERSAVQIPIEQSDADRGITQKSA
jgi:hypothetical protein